MKMITKIGLIVGALAVVVIVWGLFFGGSGLMATAWNSIADIGNNLWESISGTETAIIPSFDDGLDDGAGGLNIDSLGGTP